MIRSAVLDDILGGWQAMAPAGLPHMNFFSPLQSFYIPAKPQQQIPFNPNDIRPNSNNPFSILQLARADSPASHRKSLKTTLCGEGTTDQFLLQRQIEQHSHAHVTSSLRKKPEGRRNENGKEKSLAVRLSIFHFSSFSSQTILTDFSLRGSFSSAATHDGELLVHAKNLNWLMK